MADYFFDPFKYGTTSMGGLEQTGNVPGTAISYEGLTRIPGTSQPPASTDYQDPSLQDTYARRQAEADAKEKAEGLAYLDSQRSLYQGLLDRIGATETSGNNNIEDSYQLGLDRANTTRSRALTGFDQQKSKTKEARSSAFDKVAQNTNSLANSVRRILGLAGAAGSSAMGDISRGIAGEASRNRSNVLQDYAQNMGGLKQARDDSEADYNSLLGDLGRQRNTAKENFLRGITGQRQSLQGTIDEIAAKRDRLMGGDATAAIRQGQERYLGYEDQINALPNQYRNAVTARDVAAKPVSLREYMVDRQAIGANNSMGNDQYSPYGQFMRKQQDEEEQKLEY